jgi:hypothetical protein
MYGYNVVAVRVDRKDGSGGPQQVDNVDGRGGDLHQIWRAYFDTEPRDHVTKTRRYWQAARTGNHAMPGSSAAWSVLDLEYGPSGIPGRVVDTSNGRQRAAVRPRDAALHRYRHLVARPGGGSALLVGAEVIGRSRAVRGPLAAFQKDFEINHSGLRLEFDYVTDGEYWQEFLAKSSMVSATLTRQSAAPAYLSRTISGADELAVWETTIKPVGRGRRWASTVVPALLNGQVSPRDAFGIEFQPDRTAILLEADGQRRRSSSIRTSRRVSSIPSGILTALTNRRTRSTSPLRRRRWNAFFRLTADQPSLAAYRREARRP